MNIMSGLKDFFNASSLSNALKCPVCAAAVGYSLIIRVPCVFLAILVTLFSNITRGRSTISLILISNKLASIRSAILSSAISRVMYRTFLPCSKVAAAM